MKPMELFRYNPMSRRDPSKYYYRPELRLLYEHCPDGIGCEKDHTHSKHEVFYHPLNYKTEPCRNGAACMWRANCAFIHRPLDRQEETTLKFWDEWRKQHSKVWDSPAAWKQWATQIRSHEPQKATGQGPSQGWQKMATKPHPNTSTAGGGGGGGTPTPPTLEAFLMSAKPNGKKKKGGAAAATGEASVVLSPPTEAEGVPATGWKCHLCFYVNPLDTATCALCEEPVGTGRENCPPGAAAAAVAATPQPPATGKAVGWDALLKASGVPVGHSGALRMKSDAVLGQGLHSVVCVGHHLEFGKVAVKRLEKKVMVGTPAPTWQAELAKLQVLEGGRNVVPLLAWDHRTKFIFLCSELCDVSLQDVFGEQCSRGNPECDVKAAAYRAVLSVDVKAQIEAAEGPLVAVLRGMCQGLLHLHTLGVVHGNLKPSNVLLKCCGACPEPRLTDFALHQRCPTGEPLSGPLTPKQFQTVVWRAPELLQPGEVATSASDVFSLGCVLYYVVTGGLHPFCRLRNTWLEVAAKVAKGAADWSRMEATSTECLRLLTDLVAAKPTDRSTAQAIVHHVFFWPLEQKARFLFDLGEYLGEQKLTQVDETPALRSVLQGLESEACLGLLFGDRSRFPKGLQTDWREYLTNDCPAQYGTLYHHMAQYTHYGSQIRFLVRFIRNLVSHKRHVWHILHDSGQSHMDGIMVDELQPMSAGASPSLDPGLPDAAAVDSKGATVGYRRSAFEPIHAVLCQFPALCLACHKVVGWWCRDDFILQAYFPPPK